MKGKFLYHLMAAFATFIVSCNSDDIDPDDNEVLPGETPNRTWYTPAPETTFDWQLDDVSNASFTVSVVDVDAFDTSKETVDRLKAEGAKVIAYISVGTLEDWRPDKSDFPSEIIGNNYDGWEGEQWLDITKLDLLRPVMEARLDMVASKGFDGIEPDNMDAFEYHDPGFDISLEDQKAYCEWLISEAHDRGLSIGQKNAGDLADALSDDFDWMLTEDAFADDWYEQAEVYIEKGKAVFAVEYTDNMNANSFQNNICPSASAKHFTAILKDRDLTAGLVTCN